MKYAELANTGVLEQPVYEPGKPIEAVAREYGLDPAAIAKLASNENPFGPSPKAVEAASYALKRAHLYPDGGCTALRAALGESLGLAPDNCIVGNGSSEIIELLGHAFLRPGVEVVMGAQAFIVYKLVTRLFGATPVEVPMADFAHDLKAMRAAVTERTRLLFVASPNNPTGVANREDELIELSESLPPHVIFCFDEAYADYLEAAPDLKGEIAKGRKVFCLRTFSKIHGLGGLRIGYGYGEKELIDLLHRVRQPFNVSSVAQAAAQAALADEAFIVKCRAANAAGRIQLTEGLKALDLPTVGQAANFIIAKVGSGEDFFRGLQKRGVIVRPLAPYGMPDYVRITIGTEAENRKLLAATAELLSVSPKLPESLAGSGR